MNNRNEIQLLAQEIKRIKSNYAHLAGGYKSDYEAKSIVKELLKQIKNLDKDNYRVVHVNEDTGFGRKMIPLPIGTHVRKS
tara:strand:- start:194 stop:436 length:243 start_codon:yes stop_codon:yes gene_type:complete